MVLQGAVTAAATLAEIVEVLSDAESVVEVEAPSDAESVVEVED
jgi:hypothetical protein